LAILWAPKRWDLSLAALSQYTTPRIPPANPWIDRPLKAAAAVVPAAVEESPVQAPPERKPPPSRQIVRHVLRARAEAVRALAGFFDQLESGSVDRQVRASAHLARAYGGSVDEEQGKGEEGEFGPKGWRNAKEVVKFLRAHGAKIATLQRGIEGGWAALGRDATPTPDDSDAGTGEGDAVEWHSSVR
jgi:glycerol-3-phosphate O-acyltransferase/dihydroxyacetone phosphate acyltransferase